MSELTKEEIVQRIEQTPYDAAQALQGLAEALRRYCDAYKDPQLVSMLDRERNVQARTALKNAEPFLKKETP